MTGQQVQSGETAMFDDDSSWRTGETGNADEALEHDARIVEAMGLSWTRHSSGNSGRVFMIDDGRVLKLTHAREAAVCLAIMDAREAGMSHPCVPRIDEVVCVESRSEGDETGSNRFAVLREGFSDFQPVPCHRSRSADEDEWSDDYVERPISSAWDDALGWVQQAFVARANGRGPEQVEHWEAMAAEAWGDRGGALEQVASGIEWMRRVLGVEMGDVKPDNIGVSASGHVGMRDLGVSRMPAALLLRAMELAFSHVPQVLCEDAAGARMAR